MTDDLFDFYFDQLDREDDEIEYLQDYDEEIKQQFMQEALEELESMTNAEACELYNTDSKEEARKGIIEYWRYLA